VNRIRESIWPECFEDTLRGFFKNGINNAKMEQQVKIFSQRVQAQCQATLGMLNTALKADLQDKIREAAASNSVVLSRQLNALAELDFSGLVKPEDITLTPERGAIAKVVHEAASYLYRLPKILGANTLADKYIYWEIEKQKEAFCIQTSENIRIFFKRNGTLEKTTEQTDRVLDEIVRSIGILQSEINPA